MSQIRPPDLAEEFRTAASEVVGDHPGVLDHLCYIADPARFVDSDGTLDAELVRATLTALLGTTATAAPTPTPQPAGRRFSVGQRGKATAATRFGEKP